MARRGVSWVSRMHIEDVLLARIADCDAALSRLRPDQADPERVIVRIVLDKAVALAALRRPREAIAVLDRVVQSPAVGKDPRVGVAAATALRMQIELAEDLDGAVEPVGQLSAIDNLLEYLQQGSDSGSLEACVELLIERAVLLERVGRDDEVELVLEVLVERFAAAPESRLAKGAAWALRNRVSLLLDAGDNEQALAVGEQLASLWARHPDEPSYGPIAEQVFDVGMLFNAHGHTDAAGRLLTLPFDGDARAAAQALRAQSARLALSTVIAASRLGDYSAAGNAMDELHGMGEAALAAIDDLASVLERQIARQQEDLAGVLANRIPVLEALGREQDVQDALSALLEQFGQSRSLRIQDLTTTLRDQPD
jgi:tetratricopeptide (TPR) repeat protein